MRSLDDEVLTWTVRPFDGQPSKRLIVFTAAFITLGVGWFAFRQPLLGLLGFAMILGSTAEYWIGTTFRLDARGASSRVGPSVTAIAWPDVKRVRIEEASIHLSPLESSSALDAFRGVSLVTGSQDRESVLGFVSRHVSEQTSCTL